MSVVITLPDNSQKSFDRPVTVAEVAAAIGPGLAKAAVAGKVDGRSVDTSFLIERDARLAIVTDKDAEGVEIIRHSTAHLLAYAVKELFPDAQVTIGPVIDNGFYYDFSYKRPFTPEDLAKIEQRMHELAKMDFPVVREVWQRDRAVEFFKSIGEHYKAEIIASIPAGEDVSLYREGDFVDLCRGPHVPSTGKLKVFKLMKVAGAYWRGDSRNEMLQRIYGTAWAKKEEQDAYLHMLEEAEKRDHRRLGRQLDLFHLQEEAPGMVFWHANGWVVWQEIEQYMRQVIREHGYQEVKTPQVMERSLWERSGHWQMYAENMFTTKAEERDYAVKPMNCPGHIQIFNQGIKSYRDLPLRIAEFGSCHRNEPSGSLHGLMRVRGFVQDDAHIFCSEEQVLDESLRFHRPAAQGVRGLRLLRHPGQAVHAAGQAHRGGRVLGPGRGGAGAGARCQGAEIRSAAGGGGVLRPQDRILPQGLPEPRVAVRHAATGLFASGPTGRRVRGRGQYAPDAGDAASGDPGFARALHRHPDRTPRRGVPALAGAGAGGGDEYLRKPGRLRSGSCAKAASGRLARTIGFAERKN